MSRAIIKDDCIVKLTTKNNIGVEVGTIPKGVGFERLRWDGNKLIDIFYLKEFYVDKNTFKLHITHKNNTNLVVMNYKDKNKLVVDSITNKVRIKTQLESNKLKNEEYKARRKNEYPDIGDQLEVIWLAIESFNIIPSKTSKMIQMIKDIKLKWPKPDSEDKQI